MTDDAYILTMKQGIGYQVSLEWVALTQTDMFKEFASTSDNGTWNKTAFLEYARLDIPSYKEQLEVIKRVQESRPIE